MASNLNESIRMRPGRGDEAVNLPQMPPALGQQMPLVHWLDTTPVQSKDKPCRIKSLDVVAKVSGLYAEVEETITLSNPNFRPLSTDISIVMPDSAVVCGYALEVEGDLVDGVVVKKDLARVAFETEQRRGADPGLVEAVRGNVYRTRVYPVPGRGTRTLRLRYVAPLLLGDDGSATLDLPMPAEFVGHRSMSIDVNMPGSSRPELFGIGSNLMSEVEGVWHAESDDRHVQADAPVRIAMPRIPSPLVALERDERGDVWFSASERITLADKGAQEGDLAKITALTVLWDASGSRASVSHDHELELLSAYCAGESVERLTLVVFADRVIEVRECASAEELVDAVRGVRYDGGTNLVALADALRDVAGACDGLASGSVCLLFSDGLDTLADETFTLPAGCAAMAVVSGQTRDVEALRQACHGRVVDAALAPHDARGLARAFGHDAATRLLDLRGTGIKDVCDVGTSFGGWRAVVGRLTRERTTVCLGEGGSELVLDEEEAHEGAALSRAWAARRVTLLAPRASDNVDELMMLGKLYGVVSPVTSLLVLEELDQYLRYDVEPPKTWRTMRRRWLRYRMGAFGHESQASIEARHLNDLEREWERLMEWWEHDYGADRLRRSISAPTPRFSRPRYLIVDSEPDEFENLADGMADSMEPLPTGVFADGFGGSRMAAAPASAVESGGVEESGGAANDAPSPQPTMTVRVRPWMPDTPYLGSLDEALDRGLEAAHDAYADLRAEYRDSPSFFLDCAGWFLSHDDEEFGLRVLSNLAELRIDDAALLRVMAWRLREAGCLEQAARVLRRITHLRGEDSQSYRDLALVADELARATYAQGDQKKAAELVREAAECYRKVALTPWERRPMAVGLFAVEEYNVLRAWVSAQAWEHEPALDPLSERLEGVPDCDLRITLAWDADETDVDIHVTEPSGEEAYYANRRTYSGGRVSEDITDGYGPELYEVRKASTGTYTIRAHYYASHQQRIFGPATCTLTVYTDWGRPEQHQKITTTRLDQARLITLVGTAAYGVVDEGREDDEAGKRETERWERQGREVPACGMTLEEVSEVLGEPDCRLVDGREMYSWDNENGNRCVVEFTDGRVSRVLERMPWGELRILEQ